MKPLGHTETKEGREASTTTIDKLLAAWEEYSFGREDFKEDFAESIIYGTTVRKNHFLPAMRLIAPIRPSIDELNSLALHLSEAVQEDGYLGLFLTAGYQLAPERKIVYPFHTPKLTYLGTYLCGKELRIDGSVGDHAGSGMIGGLRVRGSTGSWAGYGMVGVLENEGRCGDLLGMGMVGTLREGTDCGSLPGEMSSGVHLAPRSLPLHFYDWFTLGRHRRERVLFSPEDGALVRAKKTLLTPLPLLLSRLPLIRPNARRIAQRRYREFLRAVRDPSAPYDQTYKTLREQYSWKVRW
jgi:hypothetical protein